MTPAPSLKPLALILALVLAAPALAAPAPTPAPLPNGRLLLLSPAAPHSARFLAMDQSRRQGDAADAWIYVVYVPAPSFNGVILGQALLHQTLNCSRRTAQNLGWTDYDPAGRVIAVMPGGPVHPIQKNSPEEAAEKALCFGQRPTAIRAILGHNNAYRAAHMVLEQH